jgi:putative DNA-invertase from lambdoid prophage Rac
MKAVPYLRVSTDDKGQDPQRQMLTIRPWAERYDVDLLPAIVDEGTSASKTDPFQRKAFRAAIEAAQAASATAIIVEQPDRFTRRGSRLYGYYKTHLDHAFHLKLWCVDRSMEHQDSGLGELLESVQAYAGREKYETLSRRVKEGMAKARALGHHIGQPKKIITQDEHDLAAHLRETGMGWDRIALQINELRGCHRIATPDVRKRHSISGATVRRSFFQRTDFTPTPPPQVALDLAIPARIPSLRVPGHDEPAPSAWTEDDERRLREDLEKSKQTPPTAPQEARPFQNVSDEEDGYVAT